MRLSWTFVALISFLSTKCNSFSQKINRKNCILREKSPSDHTSHSYLYLTSSLNNDASAKSIDYQSDEASFGRGEMHLSAVLEERDVVVYQMGTWEVDGVMVGTGDPPSYEYCVVETLQVVWTHNCEHGFISGLAIDIDLNSKKVEVISPLEFVDFGPEQLVARLPVNWLDDEEAELLVDMPSKLLNDETSLYYKNKDI